MPDIGSSLSQIGLPAGAIALAVGLVRGAKALETDAKPEALKYVSNLILEGDPKNIGKASTSLVPFIFDRMFGLRPFSFRFISRSIIATTLFWLFLLLLRHPNWAAVASDVQHNYIVFLLMVPLWYILDWLSLIKARWLIALISRRYAIFSTLLFVCIDIIGSYILAFVFSEIWLIGLCVILMNLHIFVSYILASGDISQMTKMLVEEFFINFNTIIEYFTVPSITLGNVIVPSTLLTSMWTFLLFVSCLIAQLLVPIDYLRRFATWWFKDVEHKPLTAIAKVAATLIVVGALAIKGVRWVYGSA